MSASAIYAHQTYETTLRAGIEHGKIKLFLYTTKEKNGITAQNVMAAFRDTLDKILAVLRGASLPNTIPIGEVRAAFTEMLESHPPWLEMSATKRHQVLTDISNGPQSLVAIHNAGWFAAPSAPVVAAATATAALLAAAPVFAAPTVAASAPVAPPAPAPGPVAIALVAPVAVVPSAQPQPPLAAAAVPSPRPMVVLVNGALQAYLNAAPPGSEIGVATANGVGPQTDPYAPNPAPNPKHGNKQWARPGYEPAAAPLARRSSGPGSLNDGEFPDPQPGGLRYFCPFCPVGRRGKKEMKAHILSVTHGYGTFPVNRWTLTPRQQR